MTDSIKPSDIEERATAILLEDLRLARAARDKAEAALASWQPDFYRDQYHYANAEVARLTSALASAREALNEANTNGRWNARGDWCISSIVYARLQGALAALPITEPAHFNAHPQHLNAGTGLVEKSHKGA